MCHNINSGGLEAPFTSLSACFFSFSSFCSARTTNNRRRAAPPVNARGVLVLNATLVGGNNSDLADMVGADIPQCTVLSARITNLNKYFLVKKVVYESNEVQYSLE